MEKQKALQQLYQNYQKKHRLKSPDFEGRNFVPGHGNLDALLMFIGEAPGRFEDLQKKPFVGRAGQLLDKTIEALNMPRSEVFISNIVKLRPPNNRTPLPREVDAFKELIHKEIEIIDPKVLCLLGATSTKAILGEDKQISKVRGTIFNSQGRKIIPIYHPAYLLRNPHAMPYFIADLEKAINLLKNSAQ
jgi:uracil-DNA glycosylase